MVPLHELLCAVETMQTILIIDDDPQACEELAEYLENEGYQTLTAADGQVGLVLFRVRPVGLVITDMIMPKKEGIETILELRREKPNVKIIAISGGGRTRNMTYLDLAKRMGADRVLPKPVDLNTLGQTIRDILPDDDHNGAV